MLDKVFFKIFIIGVEGLWLSKEILFFKLLLYLSITGMLRIDVEQCFMRHGYVSYIAVGGGMVGFRP